jgi:hypothetical protein
MVRRGWQIYDYIDLNERENKTVLALLNASACRPDNDK